MSTEKQQIHPTAIIHDGAKIADSARIGPYCIVGKNVRIDAGTVLQSHVVVDGHTQIGGNNNIYPFASLGLNPQDLKYSGEKTSLKIGDRNVIRESVTIHCGTVTGRETTLVGNDNFLMVGIHIAHDCIIGDEVIMANGASIGGHVVIESQAVIGAMAGIHQFVRVGKVAMIAAFCAAPKDVPPFTIAAGDRARLFGLNRVGLQRVGVAKESVLALRKAYRILFQSQTKLEDALKRAKDQFGDIPEVKHLIEFIEKSERGVLR